MLKGFRDNQLELNHQTSDKILIGYKTLRDSQIYHNRIIQYKYLFARSSYLIANKGFELKKKDAECVL